MSIINRVIRMLGFSLERYSDPSSLRKKIEKLHPDNLNRMPLIDSEQALKALKTVGRSENLPTFTYYQRPERSSDLMEMLENKWWNAHGNLIEKAWVFSENTNHNYRMRYVSKAASFFSQGNKKVKILDLGCGSGWFGRMIASDTIDYVGMDFSSTQIEIANKEKEKSPYKDHLNYFCLSDFKKIENIATVTGVVIHAFLHHLYWEELRTLFDELLKVLPAGCKFFIMEPVYPDQTLNENTKTLQSTNNAYVSAFRKNLDHVKNELIDKKVYDTLTESELIRIEAESRKNGFFFSPKEVPFKLGEFESFLGKYLKIENRFHCGVLNLETAQFIEKIRSQELQKYYSDLFFPLVNSLDEFLIRNDYFETNQYNYLFTAFECSLKK